jgi:SAM-dependent methyltransferase
LHPKVYKEFEKICSQRCLRGAVLEVGAVPNETSLLNMKSLAGVMEKIGINIEGPFHYRDFSILRGNANNMVCFEKNRFDVVLCNAVLEHDKFFWKTVSEMKRVTKPGGLLVIGAPGYKEFVGERLINGFFSKVPLLSQFFGALTIVLSVHNFPGDYYRFSLQTFREVLFKGMNEVEVRTVLMPPRIIGSGIKP